MLAYLLDEHISPVVAEQIVRRAPSVSVQSIHRWQGGMYVGQEDEHILLAAAKERLTLVTYDLRTVPTLLSEFAAEGVAHAGVLFVDASSIRTDNFGGIVKALLTHWRHHAAEDWSNRVAFLEPILETSQ